MNFRSFHVNIPVLSSLLLAVALLSGCETLDESKYGGIQVSPTYATLGLNRSVTLTATGGWNYRWSLADTTYGSLSSTAGNSVTYTVRKLPAENEKFTQKITVSGRVSNYESATATTNTALYTAEAFISHGSPSDAVSIAGPDEASIAGAPVKLTASGGDGVSYSWKIANSSIGVLSGSKGREVTYKAGKTPNATQTVTLSSGGRSYQKVIIHKP